MNIPADKVKHALAGFAISLVVVLFWHACVALQVIDGGAEPLVAVVAALVAGVTKEAADYLDNQAHPGMHSVELLDVVATTAGSLPIALWAFLVWHS